MSERHAHRPARRLGAITFRTIKAAVWRIVAAVLWLAVMAAIAFGAAGIVNAMDHQPGTPSRAELTSPGDREVTAMLDTATKDLGALADQVAALGLQARGALAALNGVDSSTVDEAITAGNRLVAGPRLRTVAPPRDLSA